MKSSRSSSGRIGVSTQSRKSTLRRHGVKSGDTSAWYGSSSVICPIAVNACSGGPSG